jgi:copper transport protein
MLARQGGAGRWLVVAVLALALAVTPTMSSHARAPFQLAAISPTADAIHVIAAGAWLGTLAVMFLSVVRNDGAGETQGRYLSRLLVVFSPLALVSAGLVVLSGILSSLAHIDRVASLVGTPYGQTLMAKLAGVFVVFVLGWRNWRHAGPQAATRPTQMKRAMVIELVIAAIVLLITAALVVTPPPMDAV